MFGKKDNQPYPETGTSAPIYIARGADSQPIEKGQDYFLVQIHSAQAAFTGSIWDKVTRLVVTSQVKLSHPNLGRDGVLAIQRSRKVVKERAEQLGLQQSLIHLVPAVMTEISISIKFILDKENRLAALGGLINDDSFLAMVSLAPGAALAAKTISGLANKVIQTFIPREDHEPILQFNGDFDISTNGLHEGYYVILGTTDKDSPIPSPLPVFTVRDGELLADNERITRLSYVILEVRRTKARTRDLNDGAPWDAKLREAEDNAAHLLADPLATDNERKQAWDKCRNLIREAQILLREDPNYLRSEAESIVKMVYHRCSELISEPLTTRRKEGGRLQHQPLWQPDVQTDRALLDIPLHEDLDEALNLYAAQVDDARHILEIGKDRLP